MTPTLSLSINRNLPLPAIGIAAAVLSLSLLSGACGGTAQQAGAGPAPAVPVRVAPVVRMTVPVSFQAIGNVEPIETVAVKARIGGELLKISFREGQAVRAGEVLFSIDPRPYEAALKQAQAQLTRDQALLKKAEEDVSRYAGLVERDFVTKEQYDQITTTAASLRATIASDEANVENAKLQLAYCTITAPVGGRTGALSVKVGALIKANDDNAMVTINRTMPIYASFAVPAQILPQLLRNRSHTIKVTAAAPQDDGAPSEGELTFIDNAVDTATSTIVLKATFPNQDERLWPGEFVNVTVVLGEEADRVVAPAAAVQTGQQGQYVYVVKDDQTVELRVVKVARMNESEAVIADGLTGGETVVTDGQLRLTPGARVETAQAAPAEGSRS